MSDNGEMYRMALGSLIAVGEAAGVRPEDQLNGAAEIIEAIEAIKARRDSWRRRAELAEAALAAQGQASAADESADFEKWRSEQIASLQRMGYPDAARAFRSLGSVMWGGWQARAIRAALPAAEQPEKLLARPAKVGAVLFHAGVPERLVIECAQWHYGYEQAPPFGDDQIAGLALRLAAKLEIGVMIKRGGDPYERNRSVVVFDSAQRRLTEPHKGDECAATRRAIVRAAAEIGRGAE